MLRKSLITMASLSLCLLLSCAGGERRVDNLTVAPTASDNPAEEIAQLEKDLNTARTENAAVLSPGWFRGAELSVNRAKVAQEEGKSLNDIYKEIAQGKAQLERAKEATKLSQKTLSDVSDQRKLAWDQYRAAEAAGSTGLKDLAEDLNDADGDFRDLTAKIEDDKAADATAGKAAVINKYRSLQATALKKQKLDTSKRVVEQAKAEGGNKYAPKTVAYAEEVINSVEKFIDNSPGAGADIDKKAKEASFYSNRALEMTRSSRKLAAADPENRTLWVEGNVQTLGTGMGLPDMRDHSLESQFDALKGGAKTGALAQQSNSKMSGELEQLQRSTEQLTAQSEKVKEISGLFNREEAEVLVKDNNVVIRLRGMKFPSGGNQIGADTFPLLAKVTKAIELYPNANIVVEGHTDSIGAAALNAKLSQERAEAVKNYLVSAKAIEESKVTAAGYGYSRPIASNKTAAGRATNRRIDIVIAPAEPTQVSLVRPRE